MRLLLAVVLLVLSVAPARAQTLRVLTTETRGHPSTDGSRYVAWLSKARDDRVHVLDTVRWHRSVFWKPADCQWSRNWSSRRALDGLVLFLCSSGTAVMDLRTGALAPLVLPQGEQALALGREWFVTSTGSVHRRTREFRPYVWHDRWFRDIDDPGLRPVCGRLRRYEPNYFSNEFRFHDRGHYVALGSRGLTLYSCDRRVRRLLEPLTPPRGTTLNPSLSVTVSAGLVTWQSRRGVGAHDIRTGRRWRWRWRPSGDSEVVHTRNAVVATRVTKEGPPCSSGGCSYHRLEISVARIRR